ncbi:TVP38/TMEM64 family protein [Halobacillus sp. A5]|uniref:TVP38/TMEM64 family protein n=1 Tax=Halobacillus sp. A5 TaxID=2880263 RepID=UPI0020A69F83|nr:VTT domain-containing protein [Halobacillus sp. A5]MCP3025482.1 VTT domain-containing protein [Halobacillus sp. A5]
MSEASSALLGWIEHQGIWAPLLFIMVHLLRPFFFLPVMLVCITGGVLFGPVAGTAYSVIGTLLSSLLFYRMIRLVPSGFKKLRTMYGHRSTRKTKLTVKQVAILRLIPFIHFHLLSYYLIESSVDFKDYAKSSFLANIPLAVVYTTMGQWIKVFSVPLLIAFISILLLCCYMIRKRSEVFVWKEFFQPSEGRC